jgi:hypothetical protein
MGYSSDESGFMGACLLLTGVVAAIVTAPLFDRVFTYHLAFTAKVCAPATAIGWFSLIWAGMCFIFASLVFCRHIWTYD